MKTNLIKSIATRRNPAMTGTPSCAVMAFRQGSARLESTIAIKPRPLFAGSSFGYPTSNHQWDQESFIREERCMA
jgi:hypothetical protein